MHKNRLEAFSDGVLAIVITILVLELKLPHGEKNFGALWDLRAVFLSYLVSFIYLGIYWNNHHHLFQAVQRIGGGVLWANLHLLFWLSLFPFVTAWMGESHFAPEAVSLYGGVLLMAGVAYRILVLTLLHHHGPETHLAKAIGDDRKGKLSVVLYAIAIPTALWLPWLALALFLAVAVIWLVPDRRIEKALPNS
ncbi:MAG: DUF1211 domain-containing protein [Planctomycetes bacterium]|nr:DUF1211 domain-containing protein [Planctomycetota bacterium]